MACAQGFSKIALQLIDKADVNIQNRDRITALHYACIRGWEDVVSKLIEKGAKVDVVDAKGDELLSMLVQNVILSLHSNSSIVE